MKAVRRVSLSVPLWSVAFWIVMRVSCWSGVAQAEPTAKDRFNAHADLPPLLEFADGRAVPTAEEWQDRREEIRQLMMETFVGTFPEEIPAIISSEILDENRQHGVIRRRVKLTFETKKEASFEIRIWTPKGEGPFPIVFVAPASWQMSWPEYFVSHGYMVCLYPGLVDPNGEFPDYHNVWKIFQQEYPKATWSKMGTNAWIAGRALDYLLDVKQGYPIHRDQVGMIGWSRYGKLTLITGAFDERFTALLARSAGSPGSCPYRFSSRNTFNEPPADFQPDWFLNSLKGYNGREHELPMDSHGWLALIAPRHCQLHTAHQDYCDPTFGVERAYVEAKKVYRLLGQPENLYLRYRVLGHKWLSDAHMQDNLRWFDRCFGRGLVRQSEFVEELIHHFDWDDWKSSLGEQELKNPFTSSITSSNADRRKRIRWMLGHKPDQINVEFFSPFYRPGKVKIPWDGQHTFRTDYVESMDLLSNDQWEVENGARLKISFGENVPGSIYYNTKVKGPAPVVIWLHPYSYSTGYNAAYGVQGGPPIYWRLVQEGFVVLAYDQCGFGLRILEKQDFYKDYPRWSLLGRLVHDLRSAVDFIHDGTGASADPLPEIDTSQIYVLGYSLGGMVGLYGAALDQRITGVASFCGFTPMRTDTDEKQTGGIRRFWEWHALLPRLGLFEGRQEEIPYDFDDVLSLIAPRPCLIYSPTRDRDANLDDVVECLSKAKTTWQRKGQPDQLIHLTPEDTNRFQKDRQHPAFIEWIHRHVSIR